MARTKKEITIKQGTKVQSWEKNSPTDRTWISLLCDVTIYATHANGAYTYELFGTMYTVPASLVTD